MTDPGNSKSLVSIVTIVFNDVNHIQETIDSVHGQSYQNIEYIVIDGDSSDGTKDIIKKNKEKIDYWLSEPDKGIYDAINKGINLAKGDYIGLLHSGDIFATQYAVEKIIEELLVKNVDSVFSDLDIVDQRNIKKVVRHYSGNRFSLWKLRMGIMPPHPTFYCKRELFNSVGKYTNRYRVSSDYEMMVRMFYVQRVTFSYLPMTIVKMRSGGESNKGIAGQIQQNMEILDAAKRNGLYTNIFILACKIPFKLLQFFIRS